jgi:hypothetical protein
MAESWNLTRYFGGLADELHDTPSQLNLLIPEWTQKRSSVFRFAIEDGGPGCVAAYGGR